MEFDPILVVSLIRCEIITGYVCLVSFVDAFFGLETGISF